MGGVGHDGSGGDRGRRAVAGVPAMAGDEGVFTRTARHNGLQFRATIDRWPSAASGGHGRQERWRQRG